MTWFFQGPAAQANGFLVHPEDSLNPLLWGLPTLDCRTVILTQHLIKPCFENPPDIKLPIFNTFWLSLFSSETLPPFVRWHSFLEEEKEEMATHSSILAWRIPWIEEPGRLPSMGSQRVGHDWSNYAFTHTSLSKQQTRLCLMKRLCWWYLRRQLLMDVIVIFKAMSKCRDFYRLEVNEFANDCKTAFLKKKKEGGQLSLHQTEYICMSIDKNYLHCNQLSTI